MRIALPIAMLAGLTFQAAPAASQALTPPLAANTFITIGALDWAWASPCTFNIPGSCVQSFVLVDGFRFATASEWLARPDPSAFLDPGGNFAGGGGQMRCASSYFNVSSQYTHCDYNDAVTGFVSSGPDNLGPSLDPNAETWLVRGEGGESVIPEPATVLLLGSGLVMVGLAGKLRGRKRNSSDG